MTSEFLVMCVLKFSILGMTPMCLTCLTSEVSVIEVTAKCGMRSTDVTHGPYVRRLDVLVARVPM